MEYNNNTTERRKNKHLNDFERGQIKLLKNKGYSAYKIAKELGRASNTIRNELKRGTVSQIKNNKEVKIYYPDTGKLVYEKNRTRSKKTFKNIECSDFIDFVEEKYFKEHWSFDAICGYVKRNHLYDDKRVCTKTLYNYVDLGLICVKSIDLPLKLRRNTKSNKTRLNKIKLGKSIEERPKQIQLREEFGHWEIDTVVPKKKKQEPVLLTLTERKTRMEIIFQLENNSSIMVNKKLETLLNKIHSPEKIFKSITSDNGLEFSSLNNLLTKVGEVYFCHPNSPSERGTNERHNGLIRRFLPKGKSLTYYEKNHYLKIMNWMNKLPRKILNYKTPLECFVRELNNLGLIDDLGDIVQFDIAI